jgi:tRNA nucleotidyltransferase (CCA-adding enzyme)
VGGSVRDLLLERPQIDLDLVLEGDAIEAARRLGETSGGQVQTYPQFGTTTLRHNDITLDLVTARAEVYTRSGALPIVTPGSIIDDLARRDFSVNAMALRVDDGSFTCLDPHNGLADIERKELRVLHARSFIDDATRILRGARYEARLDFRLEAETEDLARRDVDRLDNVSGDRIRHELLLTLAEEKPEIILLRLEDLGVLRQLHPSLRADSQLEVLFAEARRQAELATPDPVPYLPLLTFSLSSKEAVEIIERLNLSQKEADPIKGAQKLKTDAALVAQDNLSQSALARRLEGLSPSGILAVALSLDNTKVRDRLIDYLANLRHIKHALSGKDLLNMGVPEGPLIGQALRAVQDARWNGEVSSREEEEAWVAHWLKRQS